MIGAGEVLNQIGMGVNILASAAEISLIAIGCMAGPGGCAYGYASALGFHNTYTNPLETFISLAETDLIILGDILKGNSTFDFETNTIVIGKDTATTLVTQGIGLSPGLGNDAIVDAAVDTYLNYYFEDVVPGVTISRRRLLPMVLPTRDISDPWYYIQTGE